MREIKKKELLLISLMSVFELQCDWQGATKTCS